jgi:MMPL family
MDYGGFLMTRIRERWSATGHAHQAVIEGLAAGARMIASAALITVSVFCAFVINGDPNVKQFGLGLAVAVARRRRRAMPGRARRDVAAWPRRMVATTMARAARSESQRRRRTVVRAAGRETRDWTPVWSLERAE